MPGQPRRVHPEPLHLMIMLLNVLYIMLCGLSPGTAETAVEAVNDGKIAAWTIHTYLQGRDLSYKKQKIDGFISICILIVYIQLVYSKYV